MFNETNPTIAIAIMNKKAEHAQLWIKKTIYVALLLALVGCEPAGITNTTQPISFDKSPSKISSTLLPSVSITLTPVPTPKTVTLTPIVFPDTSFSTIETIYENQLNPSWNYNSPGNDPANVRIDQSNIAVSGNAIKAKLLPSWSLDFSNDLVDWESSQWLEFDLYIDSEILPEIYTIEVCLRDADYNPSKKIQLFQSPFIEGAKIKPGNWQHVQIPLDLFGTMLTQYDTFSIRRPGNDSNSPLTIYVDNVILRGKSSVVSSDGQIINIYDNFDDPKYDGGLNDLLWTREDQSSSTAKVIQQDGILMISDMENTIDQGALLTLSKWQKPTFGFMEARIKVLFYSGSNGNLALAAVSPAIKGGWTEMSLTPDAGGATMRVLGFAQSRIENDTWYILRIEYDDEKNVLSFFLDGKLVTSFEAPNKIESLIPQISLWHPERGSGLAFIDYVTIGD